MAQVFSLFSCVSPASSATWHSVSSTCPPTMPSAPAALASTSAAAIRLSADSPGACAISRNASGCKASPASIASVSPYTL